MLITSSRVERAAKDAIVFRFRVVSEVLARELRGQPRPDAVAAVSGDVHPDASGVGRRVSARTVYRWLAAYLVRGIDALAPASRRRTTTSIVLPPALLAFVAAQKATDLRASLPEILKRARVVGIIAADLRVDRSTLYRACLRMAISVIRRRHAKQLDSRRFAYPHRMTMVLADGKHFRAGASRAKRVVIFYLDDATRLGLQAVVGPSESRGLFLRGLYESIQHHGYADIYFLDHGAGFIADDTVTVVGQLPALLIHGTVAYPQGHGKIERFNQTALEDLLRAFDGRADIDPTPAALELRINHWLRETYNHRPHESLGDDTPWERFSRDAKALRFPADLATLRDRFNVHLTRTVSNDHIVSVDGTAFEVPRGLARQQVLIEQQVLDQSLRIRHDGRLIRLHPVDLAANAREQRGVSAERHDESATPVPAPTAADLDFQRRFEPIIGVDGGFQDTTNTSTARTTP